MKTKEEIKTKIKQLEKLSNLKYTKNSGSSQPKNNYRYGQYLALKWIINESLSLEFGEENE